MDLGRGLRLARNVLVEGAGPAPRPGFPLFEGPPATSEPVGGFYSQVRSDTNDLTVVYPPFVPFDVLSREAAWSVPAAAQGIQVIASTGGTLPLRRWRGDQLLPDLTLVAQPDPDETASITITRTLEDQVLFPEAWWLVLEIDPFDGRPVHCRYLPNETVLPDPDDPTVAEVDGQAYQVRDSEHPLGALIRLPGPTPGLLRAGCYALRTARMLEMAAQRYSRMDVPVGYLKNTGAVDLPDDEIDDLLTGWEQSRQLHTTAYLNAVTDYQTVGWNAEQLQLVQAREHAAADIARLLNLPPRYVNAPTEGGSQTYANLESARRDLLDLTVAPYLDALAGRLSMSDVTPRGQTVRFDLTGYLRSDFATLTTVGVQGVGAGLFTVDEWRQRAGLPPMEQVTP